MAEGHLEVPRGCPWPWATVKFYTFYFVLSFTLYLAPALPALLFFLIFYSLFGTCPARPFIFPYLLLFIWPLPCPPFYFSLSFTLYLAPSLPALSFFLIFYSLFCPCPSRTALPPALPCKTYGQMDPALPPAPPCPVWPPVFPNPVFRIRLFGPNPVFRIQLFGLVPPRQLKRGTVVGRTDRHLDFKTWSCPSIEVLKPRSAPGRTDRRTDGHTVVIIYKI